MAPTIVPNTTDLMFCGICNHPARREINNQIEMLLSPRALHPGGIDAIMERFGLENRADVDRHMLMHMRI
jgi:hypothetical protein